MPAPARKVALTDKFLKALKPAPAGKRVTIWDAMMPNLAVRITDKGSVSFVAVRRVRGRALPTWDTLGRYDKVSLAAARERARDSISVLEAGEHPREHKERLGREAAEAERLRLEAEAAQQQKTFAAVAEDFVRLHLPRLRTARASEALIRRELIPVLGDKPIGEVRRRDIIALVEAIRARGAGAEGRPESGGEYAARHALAQLSKLFNWAIARDIDGLDANPCAIKASEVLGRARARTRVLSDDEVRAVWRAAGEMGQPFGVLFKLLLLTGQRENEIASAAWREIDLDRGVMTIGAERMKGGEAHMVPLTPATVALLAGLPQYKGGEFALTTTAGRRPISGFSKAKAKLDELSGVSGFQIHDLRRTTRTKLSALGIATEVSERVIAHRAAGIEGVYNLHEYLDEKRAALELWERHLLSIVDPQPAAANVVPMRA